MVWIPLLIFSCKLVAAETLAQTSYSRSSSKSFDSSQVSLLGGIVREHRTLMVLFHHHSRIFAQNSADDRVVGLGWVEKLSTSKSILIQYFRNQDSHFLYDQNVSIEYYQKEARSNWFVASDLRSYSNINRDVSSFLLSYNYFVTPLFSIHGGLRTTILDDNLFSFELGAGTFVGPYELFLNVNLGEEILDRAIFNSFQSVKGGLRVEIENYLFEMNLEEMYGSLRNESRGTISIRMSL